MFLHFSYFFFLCDCFKKTPMKKIQLFGGSITLDVPKIFEDCSLLREVPDHQEMWADYDNG